MFKKLQICKFDFAYKSLNLLIMQRIVVLREEENTNIVGSSVRFLQEVATPS